MNIDNTPSQTPQLARISSFALLRVSGKDAASFLHRQLSCNVLKLKTGDFIRGCYSSPKGMVYADLAIFLIDNDFIIRISQAIAEQVVKRLRMFILRDALTINIETNLGVFAGDVNCIKSIFTNINFAEFAHQKIANVKFNNHDFYIALAANNYYEVYGDINIIENLFKENISAVETTYMLNLLTAGEVLINPECYEQYVAQMLNYDLIGAIDFKKGCYPGQEYIARTQYRGKVRSRCAYLIADKQQTEYAELFATSDSEIAIGKIINIQNTAQHSHVLACIRVNFLKKQNVFYTATGNKFYLQNLPYDLQIEA